MGLGIRNHGLRGLVKNGGKLFRFTKSVEAVPFAYVKAMERRFSVYMFPDAGTEIIDDNHVMTRFNEYIRNVRTDKSGTACYQYFHNPASLTAIYGKSP